MIRQISVKDISAVSMYLANKLNISFTDAKIKARKIIKSGNHSFLLDEANLQGICYVETKVVNNKKVKFIEIIADNWRLAESFIQILKWNLNGEYFFALPKHHFLNRTYNKKGIKFFRVEGDKNLYIYNFEKRTFFNNKAEDSEE